MERKACIVERDNDYEEEYNDIGNCGMCHYADWLRQQDKRNCKRSYRPKFRRYVG